LWFPACYLIKIKSHLRNLCDLREKNTLTHPHTRLPIFYSNIICGIREICAK
jgi:hypothetical protein